MPSVSSWFKRKITGPSSNHIDSNALPSSRRILSDVDLAAVSCQCHPNEKHYEPDFLCPSCQRFLDDCHWIKNYKLPREKFSRLSKRHWKQGAYLADGDASEGLNWDYEHSANGRQAGCHLCELFGNFWEPSTSGSSWAVVRPFAIIKLHVYYRPNEKDEARLHVSLDDGVGTSSYGSLRLCHTWRNDKNTFETIIPSPLLAHIPSNTSSESLPGVEPNSTVGKRLPRVGTCTASNGNFAVAKQWITTCLNNHTSCFNTGRVLAYPSRLIHVGLDGEDPCLHEITSDEQKFDYLTLSHCWGGQGLLSLTSASLPDFKHGIPFSSLSKNFQDAVGIVRKLGYTYLWIDSLCIIQNSKEDWKHESELMGDIYRNSVCTIAATASKDGDGGCFRLRSTLRNLPCRLWDDEGHEIRVDVERDFVAKRYRLEVNSGPLNARAWVLQERILSPRILHYSETSVYWDCQEAHCSDTGYQISDDSFLSWGFGTGDIRLFDKESLSSEENFSDRWQSSVERYSSMKLTVQSDRLIAFAGIIKYIEEVTGMECTFGLWKKHFIEHLLWRVEDSSTGSARQISMKMPSWSWASIENGSIRYFPPHKDDLAATFVSYVFPVSLYQLCGNLSNFGSSTFIFVRDLIMGG
jgi:Heterokaryon incompatibility protein (HET)